MIGRTVSHYRIVDRLGSGGMGVVYKAVDTNLGRPVALKFLPEQQARDADAVLRFQREARAASALNHPAICTIYEIEDVEGEVFIAMELLEGETLHARLLRGALPFDEAVSYALQILDALHAAHRKGIAHRDLKPANIFLVEGGRAKILDFGLAKLEEPVDAEALTQAGPQLTAPGTVAGTASYMSPEQALGQPLDARTDVFSFGLVFYEMATGRRAFDGPPAAVYNGLLNLHPPPPSTVANVPAAFDAVIEQALRKSAAARYQGAAEFRADLLRLAQASEASALHRLAAPSDPHRRSLRGVLLAVAVAVGVVLGVIAYALLSRTHEERPALAAATFSQITDRPGLQASPSLAPDGQSIVYASAESGNWDIYLHPLGAAGPTNLTSDSSAADLDPMFSPDGQHIAFRSERDGGGIFVLNLATRDVRRISSFCHNPAWSPDQSAIVCATERIDIPTTRLGISPLWILDVTTGARRQLTTVDGVQPRWSPNGHRIAYWSYTPVDGIWTIPAAGGTPVPVTDDNVRDWNPVWSPDGRYIIFASVRTGTNNLWRVRVDEATGAVLAPPEPMTTPSSNAGFVSISRDGTRMTYVDQSFTRNFSKRRFDAGDGPATALSRGTHIYRQPHVSPDGTRLAFASDSNIYVMDTDGANIRQLTHTNVSRGPRWSPDGTRIAFYSNRSGTNQIWTMAPDGSELRQETNFAQTRGVYYPVWSPDGRRITCTSLEGSTLTVDLDTPVAERRPDVLPPFPKPEVSFVAWAWSADRRHLAGWKLLADGRSAGLVLYDPEARTYRELTSIGIYPTWLADGRRLLFASGDRLYTLDLPTMAVTELPAPDEFATDYSLDRDERWLYYAVDQREGNVWLITLPPSAGTPSR